tara:strand:- start:2908 stop:3210 length:303 start_codon:yes stop_codon:yes gene_type:complete
MLKKSFTRKNLINKVHQKIGFSKNFSSNLIDNFFEIFVTELIKNNKIKISSFGTFKVSNKKSRIGRNPKNKIESIISARKVVKFKPSILVKKKINNHENN